MEKIKIGKIVNAVALRGEVKVYHYSDSKERFEELDQVISRVLNIHQLPQNIVAALFHAGS